MVALRSVCLMARWPHVACSREILDIIYTRRLKQWPLDSTPIPIGFLRPSSFSAAIRRVGILKVCGHLSDVSHIFKQANVPFRSCKLCCLPLSPRKKITLSTIICGEFLCLHVSLWHYDQGHLLAGQSVCFRQL
ncbi:hypothetical protein M432DRAFT_596776 [Thermoascus aurantiacus ATCC 26904]